MESKDLENVDTIEASLPIQYDKKLIKLDNDPIIIFVIHIKILQHTLHSTKLFLATL